MSNRVYAYFSGKSAEYGEKKYPVVFDSPISEEASETLDSATIVVPNLYQQLDLEPYQEVALSIETDNTFPTYQSVVSTATPLQYAVNGKEITLRSEAPVGTLCFATLTDTRQQRQFYVFSRVTADNKASSLGKIYYELPTEIVDMRRMLIDSFSESMTNASEKIYTYTVELMSETKYLEKFQCPNLCVTHSETRGQKTILEYIELYMDLYCPKVKKLATDGKWTYAPLITVSTEVATKFGGVPCADMSMSQPTLRQVLTSLMIQKGCIPVVRDRKLYYLDFKKDIPDYEGSSGRMTIERAMSSDSYVNTLVNMADNVMDTEDNIVSESLVFRDRENVLLRQKSNLTLETRYPIYNVQKCVLNAYCNTEFIVNGSTEYPYCRFYNNGGSYFAIGTAIGVDTENLNISNYVLVDGAQTHTFSGYMEIVCYICNWNNNGFNVDKVITKETESFTMKAEFGAPVYKTVELFNPSEEGYSKTASPVNRFCLTHVRFIGSVDGVQTTMKFFTTDAVNGFAFATPVMFDMARYSYASSDTNGHISVAYNPSTGKGTNTAGGWFTSYLYKKDISPLIVEGTKRSQLNADFLAMPSKFSSIDEMSEWLYCTAKYYVGNNHIDGFSNTYEKSNGWWSTEKTYIENIFNALQDIDSIGEALTEESVHDTFGGALDGFTVGTSLRTRNNKIANPFFTDSTANNFSLMFFDVTYTPLNSVVMRHFKETADLPIEQLNTSESGISSATLLSLNQQDTVDRLGNDVLAIHERVKTIYDVQPCPSMYKGYTVFKREMKIGKNAIDVNYYASKNHIIKNYFTSIQTKYRAYEYVDYSQSVLRRESDTVHVLISPDGYIDGDDRLTASEGLTLSLIDGILYLPYAKKLKYSYSGKGDTWYKNECSVYSTDSSIYFNYTQFDNGSEGIFIDGKYLTENGTYKDDPIGGIPQQWYEPDKNWENTLEIGFIDNIGILAPKVIYTDIGSVSEWIRTLQKQPKFTFPEKIGNRLAVSRRVGKDYTERISYTLQLDFYCDDDSLQFSKWLFLASTAIGDCTLEIYSVWDSEDFNSIGYATLPTGATKDNYMTITAFNTEHSMPRFGFAYVSETGSHRTLKFFCKGKDGLYHDMILFKDMEKMKNGYCVSYNDTKGNRVFAESTSGILVPSKRAKYDSHVAEYDRIVVED